MTRTRRELARSRARDDRRRANIALFERNKQRAFDHECRRVSFQPTPALVGRLLKVHLHRESWKLRHPFRITGKVWEQSDVAVVELCEGDTIGRGEAKGVHYLNENADLVYAQIASVAERVESGLTRASLQELLPPGGARNALDCAMWDLEAKRSGKRVWDLLGIELEDLYTPYTIGIEDTLQAMAAVASKVDHRILKIKLDGHAPLERVRAIRAVRPHATLMVDANQGWTFAQLKELAPALAELGVTLIEQPLRRGEDECLEEYASPVPLCADESCQHLGELESAARRYQTINIKLDKTGGLTHALELSAACRARGLGTMVGCMVGTSLAMAPAFVAALTCTLVDIDGPVFLTYDRPDGLIFDRGRIEPPSRRLWG
jgi:L-alanine-DL-glutamate epimerase-like enolase superfamily enzyme